MYDPKSPQSVEKYSSAVTLSDMEVFIFPELMFGLVLANAMSAAQWKWLGDPWFESMGKLNAYRRLLRVKQYIMDRFEFNLDLDTWGLTTKERELNRFNAYIDTNVLAQSNALFGYEGDKYYFDIDIRRHFGLDKYDSNIIPYWKTETIEAMEAFRFKQGYSTGAGECVSLAALYASALFAVAKIPFDKMYMMATPLHSQNFVDINEGLITNNRRIVTKNMWFNGTEISDKARRALEHERVTIVTNNTGYIQVMYDEATMPPEVYSHFTGALNTYLKTDITFAVLAAFLRSKSKLQKCFQIVHGCCGKPRYIEAEKVFAYEHGSKSRVGDETESALLHEIDEDEFYTEPIADRIALADMESFFEKNRISIDNACNIHQLTQQLGHTCYNVEEVIKDLIAFCRTVPSLPPAGKRHVAVEPIAVDPGWNREQIVEYLASMRARSPTADLAFMAYRDMSRAPWKPFLKAAIERNPVCIGGARDLDDGQVYQKLVSLPDESVYDDANRVAQPDEVWNYGHGDGLEKAITLVDILKNRMPQDPIRLDGEESKIRVVAGKGREYAFTTAKKCPMPSEEDLVFGG